MRIASIRVAGIRCFDDTGDIALGPRCNLFIGANNAGKSTLLKAALAIQSGDQFGPADRRANSVPCGYTVDVVEFTERDVAIVRQRPSNFVDRMRVLVSLGDTQALLTSSIPIMTSDPAIFQTQRPDHGLVPFLARRKTASMSEDVSMGGQSQITGMFDNLNSRIDRLATTGHPDNQAFMSAVQDVIGLQITTRASGGGKTAGVYLDRDRFITLSQMGDGVTEMVALISDLIGESGKIFILEEPETNLHPNGLKALLEMIKTASAENQFLIATHSNIVLRELGAEVETKIFHLSRASQHVQAPSRVEEVPRAPDAHMKILSELGYEFGDLGLHDAWLFLEESSAESVVNQVLIPRFTPHLAGRLRTFSTAGVSLLGPSIDSFVRLVTFIHLQPAYRGRLWARADGGDDGTKQIASLRTKFPWLSDETCATFSATDFERYYPASFAERADAVLSIADKGARRAAKNQLLKDVLEWSDDGDATRDAWEKSAREPIGLLRSIESALARKK
jgi:predicted ATPase